MALINVDTTRGEFLLTKNYFVSNQTAQHLTVKELENVPILVKLLRNPTRKINLVMMNHEIIFMSVTDLIISSFYINTTFNAHFTIIGSYCWTYDS